MDTNFAFVVFALASQVLLIAFFASHLLRSSVEAVVGRLVYALGALALLLAAAFAVAGAPWYHVLAFVLYAAWAAFGASVDLIRPTQWREPQRWGIVVPYVFLLVAALFALWIPLWYIDWNAWLAFGSLYAIHTVMNLASHVVARRAAAHSL